MSGTFDETWAELTPRLSAVLAARGVHAQDRDDILQDTALRLYRVWDSLAPDQPVWPYAVTIALNLWRDSLRHRVPQPTDVGCYPADPVADLDVERTVLARQELATLGAAIRKLAPEQRNLLLMNDEMSAVVRPLEPAERMARMRVRRELAKAVGRASALLGPIWWRWRRPARVDGFAAAAYVGVFAATVMTGAQVATAAAPSVAPQVVRPAAVSVVANTTSTVRALAPMHVVATHRVVAHRVARPVHASPVVVCPPASPEGGPQTAPAVIQMAVSAVATVENDVSVVEAPPMQADSENGCVGVG
jgi:hypothetical protein